MKKKKDQSPPVVKVSYLGQEIPLTVGRLVSADRNFYFEYDSEFLKSKLELSPFKLPLKQGVLPCSDRAFEGLFGLLNVFGRIPPPRFVRIRRGMNASPGFLCIS